MRIRIKENGEIYDWPDIFSLTHGEEFAYCKIPEEERPATFDRETGMYVVCKEYYDWWGQYFNPRAERLD